MKKGILQKSLGGIMVNVVPREVPRPKTLALGLPRDNIHQSTPSVFPPQRMYQYRVPVIKFKVMKSYVIAPKVE